VPDIPESTVVSLNGQPIYRHGDPSPWTPPAGEECIEQISEHIERYLGKIETVFHEIMSDAVHIDVHFVKPTNEYPFVRLVTSGMSDLPMTVPNQSKASQFLELMISLPPDWRIDQESFKNEEWYWPVRLLKELARLPHKHGTWLGWGHSIPNGDPAQPYAPNTNLCGAIVLPSISVPREFNTLRIDPQKEIAFLAIVPLYNEEMNLKLRRGTDALLERFGKKGVTDVVNLSRPNVAKKLFGFL